MTCVASSSVTRKPYNWDGVYVNRSPVLAESFHLAVLRIRNIYGNMSLRVGRRQ